MEVREPSDGREAFWRAQRSGSGASQHAHYSTWMCTPQSLPCRADVAMRAGGGLASQRRPLTGTHRCQIAGRGGMGGAIGANEAAVQPWPA